METNEPDVTQGTPEEPIAPGTMDPVPGSEKPEVDADAEPGPPEPAKAKDTRDIDKQVGKSLRATLRQAEQDAAYWRGVAEARAAGEKGAKDSPADSMPKQADFDDYEAFIVAKAEYVAQKTSAAEHEKLIKILDERDKRVSFQSRVEAVRAEHPDFDDVVDRDLPVTTHMGSVIQSLPEGAKILYELGRDPDEASRISKLSPEVQKFEIWAMARGLAATKPVPPVPRVSSAPPPITPLKGVSSTHEKDPAKQSDTEWWHSMQEKKRKR